MEIHIKSIRFVDFLTPLSEFDFDGYIKVLHEKKKRCVYIFCKNLHLVRNLFYDNAGLHVIWMALQTLTDLGYETLLHPPYSPDSDL